MDEPIYVKTKQLGVHCLDLARTESAEFTPVTQALNLKDPEAQLRPSQHINAIAVHL
ncbi:hypothetical protein ACK1X7_30905 [Streptomyces sp. CY1]|uniref:hypothetical protein n=1 Tax=Streptomyces sp. CY1 TaxID=3388313 RepID=UPI0039A28FE4